MHIKQAKGDQAKMELRNKPWLDQTSNHYKVTSDLDIQANKNNASHLYAQHSTNA